MVPKRRLVWQASGLLGLMVVTIASVMASPQASVARPSLVSQQFSWSDLWRSLRRPRTDKGGKGDLCLLVPAQAQPPDIMWHDRPLFVWQGLEQTIGLRRSGSETVFWRRSLTQPGTLVNQIQYTGLALQPGQTYELLLFSSPTSNQPVRRQAFTMMSARDRVPITTALQALTANLVKENTREETIAQQRVQYFSDHQLQADVLQEVFAVKSPSIALRQFATELSKEFCSSP